MSDRSGAHMLIEEAPLGKRELVFVTERRRASDETFRCSICNEDGRRKGARVTNPVNGMFHLVCNHCVRHMGRRCCR